ncbi:hypothetical protein [Sediminibacillus massiliensis]|uniref:hypothetical protein n=1 Tax=Sediminibacillus massiliensis TaxID=1926277 RepID=UPI0009887E01|nr:hypothetical protein [Sediminibacillus massiliensis]
MKKWFFILLFFALTACDEPTNKLDENTIINAELTEREKVILSTTSEQSFVFDFNMDEHYHQASVWVEKYQSGKLTDDKVSYISTEVKDKGSIIFASSKSSENSAESMFHISISSDGSTGTVSNTEMMLEKDTAVTWGTNPDIDISEEVVLASICLKGDTGAMSSLSEDFYKDVEGNIGELKEYDVVYLVKGKFSE